MMNFFDVITFILLFVGSSLTAHVLWKANRRLLSMLFCISSVFLAVDVVLLINGWWQSC